MHTVEMHARYTRACVGGCVRGIDMATMTHGCFPCTHASKNGDIDGGVGVEQCTGPAVWRIGSSIDAPLARRLARRRSAYCEPELGARELL